MQTTNQNTAHSIASAQPTITHPKEGIMKAPIITFIRRSAMLLVLLAIGITSASASTNQGFVFNGTDTYVEVPSHQFGLPSLTAEAWIRLDPTDDRIHHVMGAGDSGPEHTFYWKLAASSDGRLMGQHRLGANSIVGEIHGPRLHVQSAPGLLNDNAWHHVAMTVAMRQEDTGAFGSAGMVGYIIRMQLFIDGVNVTPEIGFETALFSSGGVRSTTDFLTIGGGPSTHGYFEGLIRDARIWDGPFTQPEIAQLVHQASPSMGVPALGAWAMDDPAALPTVVDASPNNFHGTFKGEIIEPPPPPWQQIYNVLAKDIAFGADGTVKIATPTGAVFTQTASGWAENYNMGSVARLAVDPQGYAWVVRESGNIFQQDNSGWHEHHNMLAQDIGVGADGTVKIATPTGAVFTQTASGWAENYNMGGVARLAVDPQGYAWAVTESGAIWQQDNSGWHEKHNALAQDIGVGTDGTVWITTPTGRVYKWTDSGWEDLHHDLPGDAKSIAVDPDGKAWIVMDDGAIFKWNE